MIRKSTPRFFGLIVLILALLACNSTISSIPPTPSILPSATLPEQNGIPFVASPIKFIIPDGLASSASADNIDVVTDQTGAPWDVAPAHTQITLQGYPLQNSFHVPQIFVYPAQDYAAMNQSAAVSIQRLQNVLSQPSAQYSNDELPRVPFFNAGQVFAAQEKVIQFSGGSGVRTVTQYAQDVSPINNGGLFYHFEGLTSDGKFYIVAILPTNLPFLAADNNPASSVPAGGIPFPSNNAPASSFEDYFKNIANLINGSTAEQFEPSLSTLDALVKSISTQ